MPINQHGMPAGYDPDKHLILTCALPGCGKTFPRGLAHNLGHVYIHAAGEKSPQMCKDTEHFTCSHEHAVAMAHLCLDEHEHVEVNPTVRFTHPLLGEVYECEHGPCTETKAGTDQHGIVVVYRMLGGIFSVFESEVLLGCCESHAKAATHAYIDNQAWKGQHPKRMVWYQRENRETRADAIANYRRLLREKGELHV